MSESKPVTETVILHLREGVVLKDIHPGREGGNDTSNHELTKLSETLKAQNGFIRQFWGTQVENPNLFVWTIDWESFEHHATFIKSEGYKDFMTGASKVFDFEVAAPVMTHTAFTSDATAAREAPVTEMAFLFLPKESPENEKIKLEDSSMPLLKAASDVGRCSAFAVGWIFEEQQHPHTSSGAAVYHMLLGWSSVDDHYNFRDTTEFRQTIEPVRALTLPPVKGKSMFHVQMLAVT